MNKPLSVIGGIFLIFLLSCFSSTSFSQAVTVELTATGDAMISSKLPTSNYATTTNLNVQYDTRGLIFRSALKFNLSSIPADAQIASAVLRLKPSVNLPEGTYATHRLERFAADWNESNITYANQPGIATGSGIGTSSGDGIYRRFNVMDDIKNMLSGAYTNFGWILRLSNETEPYSGYFDSREVSTTANRPTLIVTYYLPLKVTNALITHAADAESTNGSIAPTLSGGSGNYSYQWINGATGSVISTSATLTGVGKGWYGLRVIDNTSGSNTYMAFIVGVECGTATIDFKPGPEYVDDAKTSNLVKTGVNNGNLNFPTDVNYLTENWTDGTANWYNTKNLIRFRLWTDANFEFNKADMYLYGNGHNPLSRSNVSELRYLNGPWEETKVTYNTTPSLATTPSTVISPTTSSNENKVLDIRSFWNLWKTNNSANYGMLMQLQSYTNSYTRMSFHSSDATTPANRPWIQFEISLEEVAGCPNITPSWDITTETASMQVDITKFAGLGKPYQYLISKSPIPELSETFSLIHDTLGIDIDSALFFMGKEINLTHQFSGLDAGTYYVAVFDNDAKRIFNKSKHVQGSLSFDQQTGLSVSGNTINATASNGVGSLQLYMHENTPYSSFEATLESITPSGEQFVGLANSNATISNYQSLMYGFRVQGGTLFSVKNGTATSVPGALVAGDVLKINQEGGTLTLLKNNTVVVTETLPTSFLFKVGVGTQPGAILKSKYSGKLTPKPYVFKPVITYFDCDGTTAPSLRFTLTKIGTSNWTTANYSITNTMTGEFLFSGSIPANTSTVNFTQLQNGSPLSVGYYTITITGLNTQTYTEEIYLGYPTEWETIDANYAANAANSYSTLASNVVNNNYQFAKSKNVMKPSEPSGFIEFTPLTVSATSTSASLLRFTSQNINLPVPTSLPSGENLIVFYRQGTQLNAIVNIGNTLQIINSLPVNTSMKVRVLASTIEFKYGNTIQSYPRNGFTGMIRCQSNKNGFGFRDVISSFPCKEESDLHAKLKYEVDGFYHIMKKGKIKFVFDQEYDADNLKFNIYNQMDVLVRTQADFAPVSTTYGKNYLTIDASTAQDCLGRGFFYLEVINSKKEKLYLRFFNDYTVSPCDDYIIADPIEPEN